MEIPLYALYFSFITITVNANNFFPIAKSISFKVCFDRGDIVIIWSVLLSAILRIVERVAISNVLGVELIHIYSALALFYNLSFNQPSFSQLSYILIVLREDLVILIKRNLTQSVPYTITLLPLLHRFI